MPTHKHTLHITESLMRILKLSKEYRKIVIRCYDPDDEDSKEALVTLRQANKQIVKELEDLVYDQLSVEMSDIELPPLT